MDERLKFIARLLDGEKMAGLCREFGISRKTGYKIVTRYNEIGLEGLTDRSRRPYRHANQLPVQIETDSPLTRGQTVTDWRGRWGMAPNVEICLEVDAARLADTFAETVARGEVTR